MGTHGVAERFMDSLAKVGVSVTSPRFFGEREMVRVVGRFLGRCLGAEGGAMTFFLGRVLVYSIPFLSKKWSQLINCVLSFNGFVFSI